MWFVAEMVSGLAILRVIMKAARRQRRLPHLATFVG